LYQHQPPEPQTSLVQRPLVQAAWGAQSASVAQVVAQRPPLHP
jgi:hypothetical protein